ILVPSCVQFTSELIVEAVVRCIRVIEPGLGGALPTSLPPGMSARFRVGMSLAQACQDLGYKGDIGYQTFLYSNEPEIRSLLMFLVEKLPRESAESSDQPTGKSVVLQRSIAAALRAQLAVPWLPPACRLPLGGDDQEGGRPGGGTTRRGDAQEGGRPGNENVWESELLSLQVKDELKQRERGNAEEEDRIHVKKKTIDLLPDADDNLLQLQAVMEASSQRLVHLAAQWEKHRTPLIEEHRRLKEIRSSQDLESSRKLSEIKSLHDKIRVSTEESRKKEETYKQLVSELDSLPQDASRSAYTQRILEIVSNIKKQKEEITKILTDTKDLQKEINSLTGKLDRTFAVTDELVFKDAKKDESVRKSYKYLAALHENCNQLIQTIEDTGTILREIRDLEEQIETENSNKTMANLERILEDYKAIRQENAALAAKVREG
uniref:Coiled-coil domain-containing protein 22 n=1 Tax=Salarias fasciatus TaxID=181472 RepID=A0A672FD49_SALFA